MIKGKNPEIEVLRAVAVLFVIFHHRALLSSDYELLPASLAPFFSFWGGVDLFFVISGFVITHSLRDLLSAAGSVRFLILKQYAIKRVFRLLPSAWLWLAVPVLFGVFSDAGQSYPPMATLINDALAGFLNVANFYYPYCIGESLTQTLCSSPQVIGPYWSLSLEEQFYLGLPILFLLFRRKMLVALFAAAILTCLFWSRPLFSYGWFNRIDGLAWGVLLALLSGHRFYFAAAAWLPRILCGPLVVGLLTLLAWFASYKALPAYSLGLMALVSAGLVYLASLGKGLILAENVFRRCLVLIGARSYALYLVHTPLLVLSNTWTLPLGLHGGVQFAVACGVAIVVIAFAAELTYRFVEVPARNYGVRLASRHAGAIGRTASV